MIQSMIFAFIVLLVAHSLLAGDDQTAKAGEGRPDPLELIPLVTSDNILEKIQEDAKVIFVDARETAEYSEDHIPGALNLTLRQVTETSAQRLGDADLIVTFCLKDFRGYELGRALQSSGVRNVRLMKDHGINGWRKQGLPIASRDGLTDVEALALLRKCAADKGICLEKSGAADFPVYSLSARRRRDHILDGFIDPSSFVPHFPRDDTLSRSYLTLDDTLSSKLLLTLFEGCRKSDLKGS